MSEPTERMTFEEAERRFAGVYWCPKCDIVEAPSPSYRPATDYRYLGAPPPQEECLVWTCPQCGYEIVTDCADKGGSRPNEQRREE